MEKVKKLHIISSNKKRALKIYEDLCSIYTSYPVEESEAIVCIGGDGFMLYAMKKYYEHKLPFYGVNAGLIGFLMNNVDENNYSNFLDKLDEAERLIINPLIAKIVDRFGIEFKELAINEVALNRQSARMLRIKIQVSGVNCTKEVKSDGIIISTPIGSTAYNLSAGGCIVPLSSGVMTLCPIASFSPLNWRGLIIPHDMSIECNLIEEDNRRCKVIADNQEIRNVKSVTVSTDLDNPITILYNPNDTLSLRNIKKQFII